MSALLSKWELAQKARLGVFVIGVDGGRNRDSSHELCDDDSDLAIYSSTPGRIEELSLLQMALKPTADSDSRWLGRPHELES